MWLLYASLKSMVPVAQVASSPASPHSPYLRHRPFPTQLQNYRVYTFLVQQEMLYVMQPMSGWGPQQMLAILPCHKVPSLHAIMAYSCTPLTHPPHLKLVYGQGLFVPLYGRLGCWSTDRCWVLENIPVHSEGYTQFSRGLQWVVVC